MNNDEITQLKTTIQELRDELERRAFDFDVRIETERSRGRDELRQLQQTIQALRGTLGEKP